MTKYDIIFEALQEKVNSGDLTVEDAEVLNNVAFEKYGEDETEYEAVTESSEDDGVTYEEYLESMEEELFGEATRLAKELEKKNIDGTIKLGDTMQKAVDAHYNSKSTEDEDEKRLYKKERNAQLKQFVKDAKDNYDNAKVDSLSIGKAYSTLADEKSKKMYIKAGQKAKQNQVRKYHLKPSKKSLENKPAGRFIGY